MSGTKNVKMESKKSKSRNLSVYQFFQILQLEWLVADLRIRIYPKKKDKDYWNKVKEGKRAVIENIAEKNHLPSIFTDDEMKRDYEQKIYRPKGFPDFKYKDEENRIAQEPLDLLFYYYKGTEVRVEVMGEIKVGKVKSYLPYKEDILLEIADETITFSIKEVTRIL